MKAAGQTVRPVEGLKQETDFVAFAQHTVVSFAMGDKCCDKESLPRGLVCF